MWKRILPLLAAAPFFATAQGAEAPRMQALEQAIEASVNDVRLPDRTPGSFFAKSCEACPAKTLKVTQSTRFFLGKSAVEQNVFNQSVQQSAPVLGIFFDSKTSEVTRLVAFGVTSSAVTGQKSRRGK